MSKCKFEDTFTSEPIPTECNEIEVLWKGIALPVEFDFGIEEWVFRFMDTLVIIPFEVVKDEQDALAENHRIPLKWRHVAERVNN